MRSLRSVLVVILMLAVVLTTVLANVRAQGDTVTISLAVPPSLGDIYNDKLLGQFEDSHPGIKVNLVRTAQDTPSVDKGLTAHLDAVGKYVSQADVLEIGLGSITAEATRAGYWLDLAPLVAEDKTLNPDDFFPAVWQSYQWDNGIWAMPTATDPFLLLYNPDAFDKANLPYPSDKWTMDDLANAIRKLAVKNADGTVTRAGMDMLPTQLPYFFRGILSGSIVDTSTIPNTPKFASDELAADLSTWVKLDNDGLIGNDLNKAPLSISSATTILFQGQITPDERRKGELLPGGHALLNTEGFAVSGATQYPEQAYALAAWLTTRGEAANDAFAASPARKSLVGAAGSETQAFKIAMTPEVQALIDKAMANAIPDSETRFIEYISTAYDNMKNNNSDALAALQQAQTDAVQAQQAAADTKDKVKASLTVATPPPANAAGNKITLKFAVGSNTQNMPNKDAWDKLATDFAASDPDVGQVNLEVFNGPVDKAVTTYDCMYLPYNAVGRERLPKLAALDPLMAADATFSKDDILPSVLNQVTIDGKIYALPADIQPDILKYDATAFDQAGVPNPTLDWDVSQFADALKQLKTDPKGKPAFIPQNTFGSYLLSLVAAYGGKPIDFSTDPVTPNFTDPATEDAIRQVLDLAKQGYFKYHSLASLQLDLVLLPEKSTIRQDTLSAFALTSVFAGVFKGDNYKITLYPTGSKFSGIAYNLGALYINASSASPEACYRWIRLVSRTPELFSDMPARVSLMNDPGLVAAQGADTVAVYNQILKRLQDPKTIAIPSFSNGMSYSEILVEIELYKAADQYVIKDADLDKALSDAQSSATVYNDCSATLPPQDFSTADTTKTYFKAFKDCAVKADPSLAPFLSGISTN